jgi:hypothetical protein
VTKIELQARLKVCRQSLGEWMFQAKELSDQLKAAQNALAERDKPCRWTYSGVSWNAECENYHTMFAASGFPFCPGCGHRIEIAK